MSIANIKLFLKELFYGLSAGFFFFSLLEILWPGMILAYLDLNLVLIFWLVIGMIILFIARK